ncbi:MAG: RHS repeat-associated core domain-containing protein [Nitrososphaerales archaeon]
MTSASPTGSKVCQLHVSYCPRHTSGPISRLVPAGSEGNECSRSSTAVHYERQTRTGGPSPSLVHRYYDPGTGQFMIVDPLVDETGTPYAFTNGDPVNAIDPNGLDCGLFSFACAAYDATAGGVKTAANDTARFVAKHHQVIEQVAMIGGAIVGMAACDAATAGACSAFTPFVGALVGSAVYAEGGGQHTAEGYALAFASGGLVGSLSMVWGGVVTAGAGLWAGDSAIGAGEGIYDYSRDSGCHTFGGYVKAGITGASENAPLKRNWVFGEGGE